MLRSLRLAGLATVLITGTPHSVVGEQSNGSAILLCALNEAMECAPGSACSRILPEEVGAPDFFLIDLGGKSVQGVGGAVRTSVIRSVTEIDGKLILQGAEDGLEGVRDGLGWSAAIAQDNGRLVLSASGERVAFVVFGACAALTNGEQPTSN